MTTASLTIHDDEAGQVIIAPWTGPEGGYALWHRGEVVWKSADTNGGWSPLPGPPMERVMVAGWRPKTHRVAGYWWLYEDATDAHGHPMEHPTATMWRRFPAPPTTEPQG
ncbi:hypothetical protein EZH22_24645 [Xanthobacter dioxanivorans]|uniref:DUF551 domain-containing protein n=1 Tax=Xanthobacter dioxanivorans TaxID=2528964 RepID=A0A974PMW8_9HYPH|nr:hypothetical protein [Xanthobacter dioxanivorans]QRG06139.1 hypothetical protein EZH22_24645 [Xanthobacter dioxanivorans]